jgi:hypothetical protein
MVRILEVQQIRYSFLKSMPPKLMIEARGIVSSMGWSDIKLVSMEKKLSDDGILDLEFVGKPPKDIVGQVITEVMASILIEDDVEKIHGILVHARTNKSLQMIGEATNSLSADFELQKYEHMTTMAIGEEDKFPPITTFEFGEEGKSPIWGGEGKSPLKGEEGKSPYTGEEGKSPFVGEEGKTLHIGEEGKSPFMGEEGKSFKLGEEGKTFDLGEEGKTFLMGEEGKSVHLGEETDPGIEDGRTDFGENSVVGEDYQDIFNDRIRSPFNRR